MKYITLINAFESWCENNYLPKSAQLLWYKLIAIFNKAGWSEWVTVDNHRLMADMQMTREATLISNRDKLIKAGLFEYKKGKKGQPNQYKINTTILKVQSVAKSVVETEVKSVVQTVAIYRDRVRIRNIVSNILNKLIINITRVCAREELPENVQIQLEVLEETLYQLIMEGKEEIANMIQTEDLELIDISEDIKMPVNYFKSIIERKYGGD